MSSVYQVKQETRKESIYGLTRISQREATEIYFHGLPIILTKNGQPPENSGLFKKEIFCDFSISKATMPEKIDYFEKRFLDKHAGDYVTYWCNDSDFDSSFIFNF